MIQKCTFTSIIKYLKLCRHFGSYPAFVIFGKGLCARSNPGRFGLNRQHSMGNVGNFLSIPLWTSLTERTVLLISAHALLGMIRSE